MKKLIIALAFLMDIGSVTSVFAHGGRADRNGCHMDRKAGTRHCH